MEELLDLYRTGELGDAERRRVAVHLEKCEGCRSALAALDDFAETVGRAYAAETNARAAEREPDWGRLRASIVERTSERQPVRRQSWLARHAPRAAAAVVALVALGVLWQQGVRGPEDAERALQRDRPVASSDRGARRTDENAAEGSGPGIVESEATAGAELDRTRSAPAADPGLAKRETPDDSRQDLETREGGAVSAFRIEARPDSAGVVAEAEVFEEIAVTQKNDATPLPDLERFERRARIALSEADSALVAGALTQWRDSLASGAEIPADLRGDAQALADSLADFLVRRP